MSDPIPNENFTAQRCKALIIENHRIKAELRMLKASYKPEEDMLLLACPHCSHPLSVLDSGLRSCTYCSDVDELKATIKMLKRHAELRQLKHSCESFIIDAAGCPACSKALEGVRGDELVRAVKAAVLARKDYLKEINTLRTEVSNLNVATVRALRDAKYTRDVLEYRKRLYHDTLCSIARLSDSIDNCSVAKHRAKEAIYAPDLVTDSEPHPALQEPAPH